MDQNQNALDEAQRIQRGGIRLRDYTENGSQKIDFQEAMRGSRENGGGLLSKINFDKVARGLIFASLGLGLMEALMPGEVQRMIGVRRGNHKGLIRLMGFREIFSALTIWMQARPNNGVWGRVAGDALDLSLLGAAFTTPRVKKNRLINATAFVAGVTALDILTAVMLTRQREEGKALSALTRSDIDGYQGDGSFLVTRSVTINRSREDIYNFWRNFENLPSFMYHLESVRVMDERRSHWVAKAPAGTSVAWDAEIIEDVPGELIAWQSTENADVTNSGAVRFQDAAGGRGTEVRVQIEYRPPAGALGRLVAKMFGEEPGQQVKGDLNRFKQVMETGEIVRSEGSPGGLGQKLQRPAQPAPTAAEKVGKDRQGRYRSGKGILGKLLPGKRYSGESAWQDDERSYAGERRGGNSWNHDEGYQR